MSKKGLLVVLEGIDGAGKSSVLARIKDRAEAARRKVVVSREPTSGPFGQRLRESARLGRLPLEAELELFLKDRQQHVDELIAPSLEKGALVVLDRYYFSSAAYQGARGGDPQMILALNEAFAPTPDLVLLLDLEPESALARVHARGGGTDAFEKLEELRAVRRIFLELQRPYIRRVCADRSAELVAAECLSALEALL